jgi:hypothetical protein
VPCDDIGEFARHSAPELDVSGIAERRAPWSHHQRC